VFEGLGKSLKEVINTQGIVPEANVYLLAIQMLERLEILHSCGFIHNNISLESIYQSDTD
jgi:serine/threonine protein kinase